MNDNIKKNCCIIQNNIKDFNYSIEKLEKVIYSIIDKTIENGYNTFYHGCRAGIELIAAEQILIRKRIIKSNDFGKIYLTSVIPYENQASNWSEYWREKYYKVLELSDTVITFNNHYHDECHKLCNKYILTKSNLLITTNNNEEIVINYMNKKNEIIVK